MTMATMARREYLSRIGVPRRDVVLQQPLEDIDDPVANDIPVVGHGTVPVDTTGD
jgi:hypothetical protein